MVAYYFFGYASKRFLDSGYLSQYVDAVAFFFDQLCDTADLALYDL